MNLYRRIRQHLTCLRLRRELDALSRRMDALETRIAALHERLGEP